MKTSIACNIALLALAHAYPGPGHVASKVQRRQDAPYGTFPAEDDPFRFIPCTSETVPPRLADRDATQIWQKLFNPDPSHWSWGSRRSGVNGTSDDPFRGRGIYLCGYLDVPFDYKNESESRIFRLAVSKYQASGLAPAGSDSSTAGKKSERTLVINPGGPGGSGVQYVALAAEELSERMSGGVIDVLSWDPRGVNATQPAANCYSHPAYADRWQWASSLWPEIESGTASDTQFAYSDAMANATMQACAARLGDLGRFVTTALVARDLDEIRKALDEPELTAYMLSYGTELGQTYSNMFPDNVGRMILDGPTFTLEWRLTTSFVVPALDDVMDAWREGFLGECVQAGPLLCPLARPSLADGGNGTVTVTDLDRRMRQLVASLAGNPLPAFSSATGASLVTFTNMAYLLINGMYLPSAWPLLAHLLWELEQGGTSNLANLVGFRYNPQSPPMNPAIPDTTELTYLVMCGDSYDDDRNSIEWWQRLRANMTETSWFAGDLRSQQILYCRHHRANFGPPVELYRGDLTEQLKNPILMVAQTHDPATPLSNGRKVLGAMGRDNLRLVVHHGYGHGTHADVSSCTEALMKAYISDGEIPDETETNCYADRKPFDLPVPAVTTGGGNSTIISLRSLSESREQTTSDKADDVVKVFGDLRRNIWL
ncbi:hypothetical protein MCOR29_000692 [Pyricularia oryzae]|nr:hypothetical protein MCOR29_000692 [Pyricularia oryzae]KAI6437538.1 hypothetical protein MCOR21_000416 [Pyricularia oryzae]KAI6469972.1 hypothetical protein MCOR15_001522 [Pyricularia oryzae]KAI6531897.1 hypothetical protein MCOR16_004108 [Pyricularia oryzae]KAI6640840.1 hypothetical protein MCOR08_001401 [Pyricularia oryzae]